jgi:murein DD-endopeptidase MepM/ murein hydrolase activator NlpD
MHRFLLIIILVINLAACRQLQPVPTPTNPPEQVLTLPPSPSPTPSPTETRTATPEPTLVQPTETIIPLSSAPVPIMNPDTLKFVFPTPGLAIHSAWRPPLYSVPWALTPHDHFYFSRPIAADEVNWPLANYRYGVTWPGKEDVVHSGIDIDAPIGTPVLASAAGKVVFAGLGLLYGKDTPDDPYGLAVMIEHDFGFKGKYLDTVYAHMSQVDVVPGQLVTAGTRLGLVGITGLTTGPHLHFEVRVRIGYEFITHNPELWLAPPQGWGVLVGQLTDSRMNLLPQLWITVKSIQDGRIWIVRTYTERPVIKSDPYYLENMVLSDLPAGKYQISARVKENTYYGEIQIYPGMISYFAFHGEKLIYSDPIATPTAYFLPTVRP